MTLLGTPPAAQVAASKPNNACTSNPERVLGHVERDHALLDKLWVRPLTT